MTTIKIEAPTAAAAKAAVSAPVYMVVKSNVPDVSLCLSFVVESPATSGKASAAGYQARRKMGAGRGFEPRSPEHNSGVLPMHHARLSFQSSQDRLDQKKKFPNSYQNVDEQLYINSR